MLQPGMIVGGKYRLVERIGEGGMGFVWRAEHAALGRPFAIKFVLSNQSAEAESRFFREAKIAAQIRHRHVVAITDFGTSEEGAPYLVMELLDGESLLDRISRPPAISVPELVELAAGALSGLEAVHAAGIVHRDIKPGNVFLVHEGDDVVAKILDFGTSRVTEGAPTLVGAETITMTGVVVGTPYYMSDEQVRGRKDVDGRSDLYSIGVILYEALTGRLPFEAESLHALMVAIATEEPVPIDQLRPDLPTGLAAVVTRAMARSREDRFQTARELRRALLATVGGASSDVIPRTMVRAAPPADLATAETVVDHSRALPEQPVAPLPEPAANHAPALPLSSTPTISDNFTLHRDPRTRRRWPITVAIGFIVLGGAGVGLALALRDRPGDVPSPLPLPTRPLTPQPALPPTAPPPLSLRAPPPAPVPVAVAPPIAREVEVRLRGVPADGVVRVDGVAAPGPDVRLPRDGQPRRVAVSAPGRLEWSVQHTCDADGEYEVVLAPVPAPRLTPTKRDSAPSRPPPPGTLLGDPGF